MAPPVLYDAVTLRHLAVAGALGILPGVHAARSTPRWTTEVHNEIRIPAAMYPDCAQVLGFAWLDAPQSATDQLEVFRARTALSTPGDGPLKHLGEASSIVLAEELGGSFITDDAAAHDFALKRSKLGLGRVHNTCDLLSEAQSFGELSRAEVNAAHKAIRDAGRTIHCQCL